MQKLELEAASFRRHLADELSEVQSRPGGWEKLREALPAGVPSRRWRVKWALAAVAVAAALLAGSAVASGNFWTPTIRVVPRSGESLRFPSTLAVVCHGVTAVPQATSLAAARAHADFQVLVYPRSAPTSVDWMVYPKPPQDASCVEPLVQTYAYAGGTASLWESRRPSGIVVQADPSITKREMIGSRQATIQYADATRSRVAAVFFSDPGRAGGLVLFGSPGVSLAEAEAFVAAIS
jgi:hypothetical protein